MKEKIKLIYFPFLLIAISFISAYTMFNWYLISNTITVREMTIYFWLPFTLPWIPLIIWLRPRVKLLNLKRKKGNLPTLYLIVAGFAIIAPTIIVQKYFSTATGRLTKLHDIDQIDQRKPTKYYTLTDYVIDKNFPGIKYTSRVTGKYNRDLDLDIYIACPIYVSADTMEATKIGALELPLNDTIKTDDTARSLSAIDATQEATENKNYPIVDRHAPKAWLCLRYYLRISNRLSDDEKKKKYHEFYNKSLKDFHQKNIKAFTYLDRVGDNATRDGYLQAAEKIYYLDKQKDPVILEGIYEPFELRNGHKLLWFIVSFIFGSAVWLLMLFFPPFKEGEPENFLQKRLAV